MANPFTAPSPVMETVLNGSSTFKPNASSPTGKDSITGSNYSPIGTSYVTDEKTARKIEILRKKNPSLADYVANLFGLQSSSQSEAIRGVKGTGEKKDLDRYSKNVIATLFSAELKLHKATGSASGAAASGISKLNTTITNDIRGVKDDIHKALKPVSSAVGSTLGTLTNVLKDPLGAPQAIGSAMAHQMDKVNPGFMNKLDATFKKYKVDELAHLPTQMMGGLRCLAQTVDSLLSIPFSIAADIYNGLMDIMKELSSLLDSVVSSIFDLIFGPDGLLDSLIPIGPLMEFLSAVSEVVGIVGGITSGFSGLSTVTSFAGQIGNFASMGSNFLSNPQSLAMAYLPSQANTFLSGLRNPQGVLEQLVPPQIQQQLGKVGSLPGLGFVGNLGYGMGDSLEALKGGVLTHITDNFSSQMGILGPLLGKQSSNQQVSNNKSSYPPSITPSPINPNIPTVRGVPVDTKPSPLILPKK